MRLIILFATLLFGLGSQAQNQSPPTPETYDCNLDIFANDLPNQFGETHFKAIGPQVQVHGGPSYDFTFANYKVSVLANSRWRGISWWAGERLIAQTIHAQPNDSLVDEVLILSNPADTDQFISLECAPTPKNVNPPDKSE